MRSERQFYSSATAKGHELSAEDSLEVAEHLPCRVVESRSMGGSLHA